MAINAGLICSFMIGDQNVQTNIILNPPQTQCRYHHPVPVKSVKQLIRLKWINRMVKFIRKINIPIPLFSSIPQNENVMTFSLARSA